MAGSYQVKDPTRGPMNAFVTSGIKSKLDRGGPSRVTHVAFPKFLKVLATQIGGERSPKMLLRIT